MDAQELEEAEAVLDRAMAILCQGNPEAMRGFIDRYRTELRRDNRRRRELKERLTQRKSRIPWIWVLVVVLVGLCLGWPQPVLDFDQDIYPLAHDFMGLESKSSSEPLQGLVVVITGATSGIGMSLTHSLVGMGADTIVVGRSQQKLAKLGEQVNGTVVPIVADMNNLSSVARAADEISSRFEQIDVLINNAGIHYTANDATNSHHSASVQNYDLLFGVNYLSHFLLTEELLPLLDKSSRATIVQVSSSFHWAVNGDDLVAFNGKPPRASVPGGFSGVFRNQRAYGNSKLAQVLHSRALVRLGVTKARVVNVCPGWVGTSIFGQEGTLKHWLLDTFAFPVKGWGISSILCAMMDGSETDDFYTNTKSTTLTLGLFPRSFFGSWSASTGVRDTVCMVGSALIMVLQKFFARVGPDRSSPESYNVTLQNSFYQWSKDAVSEWL